jgi:hypothetical protein
MNRFLMLVGVAVVAAAMYVAASPASQVPRGVSLAKFNALNKKVTALTKRVKTDENDLNTLAFAYLHCSLPSELGISQFTVGDPAGSYHATAVDLTNVNPGWELTPFNTLDPACQSLVGSAPLRHNTARAIAQEFAQRP